jgi:hypothetical protein
MNSRTDKADNSNITDKEFMQSVICNEMNGKSISIDELLHLIFNYESEDKFNEYPDSN